jgi:hypothetical protein
MRFSISFGGQTHAIFSSPYHRFGTSRFQRKPPSVAESIRHDPKHRRRDGDITRPDWQLVGIFQRVHGGSFKEPQIQCVLLTDAVTTIPLLIVRKGDGRRRKIESRNVRAASRVIQLPKNRRRQSRRRRWRMTARDGGAVGSHRPPSPRRLTSVVETNPAHLHSALSRLRWTTDSWYVSTPSRGPACGERRGRRYTSRSSLEKERNARVFQ